MLKLIAANIIRAIPDKASGRSMIDFETVREVKEVLLEVEERTIHLSFYYPLLSINEPLPAYINLHGGAFIMNNKDMDDPYCRYLANHARTVVVNVNYSKAPETPFPGALEECYQVIQWLRRNGSALGIDTRKIAVGGQSSGGNLAAALCLLLKKRREKQPLLQVLSVPMLDFVTPHADKPEPDPLRAKYPQAAGFLNACYVPTIEQASNPLASPVLAADVSGLAPALIVSGENDAFRPEIERYSDKLKRAKVQVRYELFKDCTHTFMNTGPEKEAAAAWNIIASELHRGFYPSSFFKTHRPS
ncbi:acetyl esterase [Sinobaca qinghaiensis]|uniref:Acetyl esterase n=1 Tax=Sinobaca qinghaiensis TaxID=342944 RepID=A0A419V524_9BACL|nr:alpha/beta hydrolase [Sinobaca qinghaiensis]RKD73620.1 acetyl esterase [Sinobaca qinghaiensis]